MINPNKAIVLIAEERNKSWPDTVESVPHPIILRVKEDNHKDKKPIVYFEHGITGFESYYMEDFLRAAEESEFDKIVLNMGNDVYNELKIDREQTLKAVEALTSSEKCIWMAHVSHPVNELNEAGQQRREYKILFDTNDFDPQTKHEDMEAYFEKMMGIDPNRNYAELLADKIKNKTQHPYVHEVMLVPENYKTMPHFNQKQIELQMEKRKANDKARNIRLEEKQNVEEKGKKTGIYSWKGHLKYTPENIGKGENSGVKGQIVTETGNRVNFIAFGQPSKVIKSLGRNINKSEIVIGGKPNPRNDSELKLVFVQKTQEKEKDQDLER